MSLTPLFARNRIVIVLLGILELPFLCTCMPICQRISMKMEVFENLMLRGKFTSNPALDWSISSHATCRCL